MLTFQETMLQFFPKFKTDISIYNTKNLQQFLLSEICWDWKSRIRKLCHFWNVWTQVSQELKTWHGGATCICSKCGLWLPNLTPPIISNNFWPFSTDTFLPFSLSFFSFLNVKWEIFVKTITVILSVCDLIQDVGVLGNDWQWCFTSSNVASAGKLMKISA